ncbi:MAG: hypothetical protein V3V96_15430 [Acidiferrobacterales bacterium]
MAWRVPVTSLLRTLTDNDEFYPFLSAAGVPIIIFPKPREVVHFVFSIASEVAEANAMDWQVLGGNRIIKDSALSDTTDGSNIDLAVADNQADDYYMGMYLEMTSGGEQGEFKLITDYVTASNLAILENALSGTPTAGETYSIYHMAQVVDGSGSITAEQTLTEALPQNAEFGASGYPCLIPRAKSSSDDHVALLTYTIDGVSA